MIRILFAFILLACTNLLAAQEANMISFTNSQPIDPERYADIKGRAYLFKGWVEATIEDAEGIQYTGLKANYNGYTQEVEVQNAMGTYIILDQQYYPAITFTHKGETFRMIPGLTAGMQDNWVLSLYQGDTYRLIATKRVVMSENTVQDVGRTLEVKQFQTVTEYFLLRGRGVEKIRMSKKRIQELLGHQKEVSAFIKEKRLKLNSVEGLVAVLQFLESKGLK